MTEDEIILTSLANCRRIDLYVDPPLLSRNDKLKLRSIKERRKKGEPLQYILGQCEFLECRLNVDPRVLIPRPETEVMVEEAVCLCNRRDKHLPCRVLDIGTGSGNIAIYCAKNIKKSQVTAVDASKDALCLAEENAKMNGVNHRINFLNQDMMEFFENNQNIGSTYDMIISNPPYISSGELTALSLEIRHEPQRALDGGDDGLHFIRTIIDSSWEWLSLKGWLVMEFGFDQEKSVASIIDRHPKWGAYEIKKDLRGIDRFVIAQRNQNNIL